MVQALHRAHRSRSRAGWSARVRARRSSRSASHRLDCRSRERHAAPSRRRIDVAAEQIPQSRARADADARARCRWRAVVRRRIGGAGARRQTGMILRSWAEALSNAAGPAEIIDLHVQDALAAFHAGIATRDGQALARLYRGSLPEHAAAVAAIARASECDDIHLSSCVTPGAAVIPVALAFAKNRADADVQHAIAAGYAAGLNLGVAIGGAKALANGVWPTLLAAPLMAAVTASRLLGHDSERLAHAIALALARASGRIGRPTGTPSDRWFAFAEAVARGIRAAEAAGHGFTGDPALFSGEWLAGEAGHDAIDMAAFESPVLSIAQVGFKPFPIARQAANAVVAFQRLLLAGLDPRRIDSVAIAVPAINVALLSRPLANDRLSRISNIGFQ